MAAHPNEGPLPRQRGRAFERVRSVAEERYLRDTWIVPTVLMAV